MENPHSGDESLESLCCIKQAKQMAINHWKLFMLASNASPLFRDSVGFQRDQFPALDVQKRVSLEFTGVC